MTFRILNLEQGSPEWHAHRATARNASDAPAMLGISPYKTRAQFIQERATGMVPEVTPEQQRIFDRGHAIEALVRPLTEAIIGEDLSPCVGTDGKYSASFDGITFGGDVAWECKSLNAALREALPYSGEIHDISHGARLPEHYRAQLEQQAMVSGCKHILFTAASMMSDGSLDDVRHCWYTPDPAMRARLVDGWEKADKDIAAWEPTEQAAPATASPMESLPAVVVQVSGALTVGGNLDAFGLALREFIARIPAKPETDQQFADAEAACKALKKAEDALTQAEDGALAQISDVELMRRTVADLRNLARTTRLATEKLVKAEKDARRTERVVAARQAFDKHVAACQLDIKGVRLIVPTPDFGAAIKGLSSLASIDDKLTAALIAGQAEVNTLSCRIIENLHMLDSVPQHAHLFADRQELAYKDPETLELLMQKRVEAEAARLEAERARIRAEEERRAQAEALAKVHAEAEAERQRLAAEALAKAKAEADLAEAAAAPAPQSDHQAPASAPSEAAPAAPVKCDGNHGGPRCADPERWNDDASNEPTLNVSAINKRLAPLSISAAGLAEFGIEPLANEKNARLYSEAQFSNLLFELRHHIQKAFDKIKEAA